MPFREFALGVLAKIARSLALLGGIKNAILDTPRQSECNSGRHFLRVFRDIVSIRDPINDYRDVLAFTTGRVRSACGTIRTR
jgi:hypothetical protein